ncbi:MAG: hypothetical protein P1V97_35525 [Planctomycetota bacterium]|nr:hypothetical protein [Planctomycetota bacterium]
MQLIATDYPGDSQKNTNVTISPVDALQNLITQDTLGVFSPRGYTPFMWEHGDFENAPCGTFYSTSSYNSGIFEDN